MIDSNVKFGHFLGVLGFLKDAFFGLKDRAQMCLLEAPPKEECQYLSTGDIIICLLHEGIPSDQDFMWIILFSMDFGMEDFETFEDSWLTSQSTIVMFGFGGSMT